MLLLLFKCTPPPGNYPAQEHVTTPLMEKIYIAPIVNNANFQLLPGWPFNPQKESAILNNIANIQKQLKSIVKSSECSDKFAVVEDSEQPSMRISIIIKSALIKGDSLQIPVQVEIERISDGMIKSYSINSSAVIEKSDIKKTEPLVERLFTVYYKKFPYATVLNFICSK
jgi:hypothetical protein